MNRSHEHKPKQQSNHHHHHRDGGHHHHSHANAHRPKERNRLKWVIAITGITMFVEIAGGIISGSLALISDAGHMFTHAFALLVSLIAIVLAAKPANMEKTFGYYRVEILAALFNSISLLVITGWIFYESYHRFVNPVPIKNTEMLVIAMVGLVVNIVSAMILMGTNKDDLNVRSAFAHMIGDTASSVGIVIGAIVIRFTNWVWIDPVLSAVIALVILIWAWNLARQSLRVLLEATPHQVNMVQLESALMEFDQVKGIGDLHVWTITSNMYSLMAHLTVDDGSISNHKGLLDQINHMLDEKFDIVHTSLELRT